MSPITLDPDYADWVIPSADIESFLNARTLPTSSAINRALEEGHAEVINIQGGRLRIKAAGIASLSEKAAQELGLPPKSPYGFDLRLQGAMGKPGARLAVRWLQPGRTLPARDLQARGVWLDAPDGKRFRIPAPMFEVLDLAGRFEAAPESIDEHFRNWARIRQLLGDESASNLTDGFLRALRVVTASALTFGITTDARGEVQLDPVLLNAERSESSESPKFERAMTEEDEKYFPTRLDQLPDRASAFPINQGTYVVVDEALQQALRAVRTLRQAPADQRKRAAMYPEAVIREMLGQDDAATSVFVETEKFSDRVKDVGDWVAPVLPWIKIPSQDWGAPAIGCGIRVNGVQIPIEKDELARVDQELSAAIDAGRPNIEVGGVPVPATKANLNAIRQLRQAVEIMERNRDPDEAAETEQRVRSTQVLIVETNFNETAYPRVTVGRTRPGSAGLPSALKTTPKPHQEIGIQWLQRHWIEGSSGALLCDDMGLGKTYQALAFCAWLRELMEAGLIPKRPLLIVAPVGLLRNWEIEINEHLFPPGLGGIVRAYGDHLRGLKRGRHIEGTAALDTAALARGDLVLANFEAVSDYQLSFGAVPFCLVVLDEAQKIKSPKARMTVAAQGLNAEFQVAMTGTPVENRLADLWCIADTVQPGALADLKEFSARYERDGADTAELRERVWQQEEAPPDQPPRLLLRRLKTDKLKGLPPKHEHESRRIMPPRQYEAYSRALAMKEMMGPSGTLGMIHALRRISLHPVLAEGGARSGEELVAEDSARLAETMAILERIANADEKALVFLESLDLQESDQLPGLIKRRFNLSRAPMVINGEVKTEARQQRVDQFQRERGFDVMLLSPKAGGVGLTLTAANHVIHLSRWWNPAVEDQCSDRVYRIGQQKPVHIYYPLAVLPEHEDSSFDVQLQRLMDRKRELARNLLAAPAFTKQDYDELLRGTRV